MRTVERSGVEGGVEVRTDRGNGTGRGERMWVWVWVCERRERKARAKVLERGMLLGPFFFQAASSVAHKIRGEYVDAKRREE